MKISKHTIPDHLKIIIHSIWMVEDEISREATQQVQAFPHGYVYINVNAERKLKIQHGTTCQEVETKCYLCGQTIQPSVLEIPNAYRSLVIRFHPWVIPALFGISSAEIAEQYIPFESIDAEFNNQLEDFVEGDFPFATVAKKIEKIIESRFSYDDLDQRLLSMCRTIYKHEGALNLQSISEHHNLSHRRVQQLFKDYIGISPKKFSRIARFNHYIYQVLTGQNYAHLYDYYFDQPHFSREIKSFTGMTPLELEDHLSNFYARQAYLQNNLYYPQSDSFVYLQSILNDCQFIGSESKPIIRSLQNVQEKFNS